MREVICKDTMFCFFYIFSVLKFIRERFLRAGAPYEIHPSIRKKWGINNPSSVNAERLLLISTKIVDPLCKYWYIYHSTSDPLEVLLKRPLFRGISLVFRRAATYSK